MSATVTREFSNKLTLPLFMLRVLTNHIHLARTPNNFAFGATLSNRS